MGWLNRIAAIARSRKLERDLDEELQFHIELKTKENIAAGMPPEEARYAALRMFGNLSQVKEECRDSWGVRLVNELVQDLRYGLRQLRRNPGFTIVAILTLALGIGSSATMFNALEAVVFGPLHIKNLDRIAYLRASNVSTGWNRSPASVQDYYDWAGQNHSFEELAAYTAGKSTLAGISEPARVSVQRVSANFFRVVGAAPALGRAFSPSENLPGAGAVVILSHHLWVSSFGSRRNVLGQKVRIDGEPMTVVGVMPARFGFPTPGTDLWVPLILDAARSPRTYRYLLIVGLLKPKVNVKQAQGDMSSIARRVADQHPREERGWGVRVILVRDQMMKKVALGLAGLLGPGICVLLIVCANLAGLLFARGATREREIAVRAALGAGRVRLVRQLITESFLLSLAGGASGLVLSYWGIQLVRLFIPSTVPRHITQALHINFGVLGFVLLIAFLAPIAFGLAPALTASRTGLVKGLKEGRQRAAPGLGGRGLRDPLVAFEVTLAMVLLTVVGVWGKAMVRLERVDLGFDSHNLLTLQLSPSRSAYASNEQLQVFYNRVLERAAQIPGAKAAAVSSFLPATWEEQSNLTHIRLNTRSAAGARGESTAVEQSVSPQYFKAMGIPLLAGRYFSTQDSGGAPSVALVSRSMATRFWTGENALNKQLKLGNVAAKSPLVTVVGVVGDVMNDRRLGPPLPHIYLPYAQHPTRDAALVVRTTASPGSSAAALRSAVQSMDRDLPLGRVKTMEQVLSLGGVHFTVGLVAVFAFMALVLAAVGVYGVANFMANARTREIGIRVALGARPHQILWLFAQRGMTFILTGVGLGVLGAEGASLLLWSQVAGVSSADPIVLSISAFVLTAAAIVATYIPARRAAKVDPMVALRYE